MSNMTLGMSPALHAYVMAHLHEDTVMKELRAVTGELPLGRMQIAPEQGAFMAFLVRLIGAKRCLEVGTFTGYSALAVAMALPADGKLTCCEVSPDYAEMAQRYWRRAGVSGKIALRLGPADVTLMALRGEEGAGSFDFAFVDADKVGYPAYYEACLELLRPGGLLLFDNAFQGGKVADAAEDNPATLAIRSVNQRALLEDARVDATLVPIADGLLVLRKK